MFEIYKVSTGRVILSGLSLREAQALRLTWADLADLIIRPWPNRECKLSVN